MTTKNLTAGVQLVPANRYLVREGSRVLRKGNIILSNPKKASLFRDATNEEIAAWEARFNKETLVTQEDK